MKAISIRQPWAYAIIHLGKDVENRTWKTDFRGRVLIHAGKIFDKEGLKFIIKKFPIEYNMGSISSRLAPTGGIVGSVEIVDCVKADNKNDWWYGLPNYQWVLKNPRVEKFMPYKGKLNFFDVPEFEVIK